MNGRRSAATSRYFLMSGLLHAYYWMDESLQNHLRAAGLPAVTRTESLVLTNIADGVTRPAQLARRLGVSRQAVQQLLAGLQQRGLVDLVDDPADARAKVVRYSKRGAGIGAVTMRALEHIDGEIERRLGGRALAELRRILLESDWGEPVDAAPSDLRDDRRTRPSLDAVVARRGRTRPA